MTIDDLTEKSWNASQAELVRMFGSVLPDGTGRVFVAKPWSEATAEERQVTLAGMRAFAKALLAEAARRIQIGSSAENWTQQAGAAWARLEVVRLAKELTE